MEIADSDMLRKQRKGVFSESEAQNYNAKIIRCMTYSLFMFKFLMLLSNQKYLRQIPVTIL